MKSRRRDDFSRNDSPGGTNHGAVAFPYVSEVKYSAVMIECSIACGPHVRICRTMSTVGTDRAVMAAREGIAVNGRRKTQSRHPGTALDAIIGMDGRTDHGVNRRGANIGISRERRGRSWRTVIHGGFVQPPGGLARTWQQ